MSTCKTITISTCPDDSTCDACKEIIKSQCIKYTGEDLDCLQIKNGNSLNQILIKLNSNLCQEVSGVSNLHNFNASVRLEKSGTTEGVVYFTFLSLSPNTGCIKTYNILNNVYDVVFTGTLSECYDYRTSLTLDIVYYIEEVISCGNNIIKSTYQCFKVHNFETAGKRIINC